MLLAYVAICFSFSHCLLPITLPNLVTFFLSYSVCCLHRVLVITYLYSCSCCWYYCALSSVYSTLCYLFVRNFCTRSFFLFFCIFHWVRIFVFLNSPLPDLQFSSLLSYFYPLPFVLLLLLLNYLMLFITISFDWFVFHLLLLLLRRNPRRIRTGVFSFLTLRESKC